MNADIFVVVASLHPKGNFSGREKRKLEIHQRLQATFRIVTAINIPHHLSHKSQKQNASQGSVIRQVV